MSTDTGCPDGPECKAKTLGEDCEEWDCGGFLCAVCDMVWCVANGAADDMPEACDECWARLQAEREHDAADDPQHGPQPEPGPARKPGPDRP